MTYRPPYASNLSTDAPPPTPVPNIGQEARLKRSAAVAVLAILGACTNDIDQSTRPDNVAGTYHLSTYAGAALPTTRQVDTLTVQVVSGELILGTDYTWTEALTLRPTTSTTSQTFTELGAGTWNIIRDYAYIAFTDKKNAYQFSGVASGRTIVLQSANGAQMIYRR